MQTGHDAAGSSADKDCLSEVMLKTHISFGLFQLPCGQGHHYLSPQNNTTWVTYLPCSLSLLRGSHSENKSWLSSPQPQPLEGLWRHQSQLSFPSQHLDLAYSHPCHRSFYL